MTDAEMLERVNSFLSTPQWMKDHVVTAVAESIDAIADEMGVAIDLLASATWLTAGVDIVVTLFTGHSVGQWAKRGFKQLASEMRAARLQTGSAKNMATDLLGAAGASYFRTFATSIRVHLQGTEQAKRDALLLEKAPSDGAAFATWAIAKAQQLGITTSEYLIARANLLGGGAE